MTKPTIEEIKNHIDYLTYYAQSYGGASCLEEIEKWRKYRDAEKEKLIQLIEDYAEAKANEKKESDASGDYARNI